MTRKIHVTVVGYVQRRGRLRWCWEVMQQDQRVASGQCLTEAGAWRKVDRLCEYRSPLFKKEYTA